jgi:hypothetical protein
MSFTSTETWQSVVGLSVDVPEMVSCPTGTC